MKPSHDLQIDLYEKDRAIASCTCGRKFFDGEWFDAESMAATAGRLYRNHLEHVGDTQSSAENN